MDSNSHPLNVNDQLRLAASSGQLDQIQDCLEAGAVFDRDTDGRTALHYAALNGYTDVTKFLLEKGCHMNTQDASGYTPLHRAASQGHIEVITVLLEARCELNTQDEHGNAAIHEAAWNGFSKTLELLVKHEVNVVLTNKAGFTALHLSAQNGHNESSRVLLYAGCDSDIKNNYGDTALHTAARYGHAGVTRILISARAKMNEQNKNGDTALHIAAALKRRKIAKLLVESGVDVLVKNKQNETAADVARRKDHTEIVTIIQSYKKPPAHHPNKMVNFKDDPHILDGPVVVPDLDVPITDKQETKQDKGKRFFFFKKKKAKEKVSSNGGVIQQKTVPGSHVHVGRTPVQGFFSQYVPRDGVQYYRDLAGNVKKGPVGYTPTCNCTPSLNHLERQVHDTRDTVYDQINSHNRVMQERIDQIDHRASMRVHALEQYTRERFQEEEHLCRQRINQRYRDESEYQSSQSPNMKMQIQSWLEQKLEGYGHCLHHHHDDTALPNENLLFSDVHETANGRLFRSRSDETLSQSDNHSGKGYRKREFYESRQEAMQQIRAWQVPSYSKDRNKIKILEKQRQSDADQKLSQRSQSRQQLQSQQDMRRYPMEPKIEIRNNQSTRDTVRSSQHLGHNGHLEEDSTYVTMNNYSKLGAITKPTQTIPQTPSNTQYMSGRGSRGPLTHSTPKSNESSPYDSAFTMARSKTEGHIFGHSGNELPKSNTDPRLSTNVLTSDNHGSVKSSVQNPSQIETYSSVPYKTQSPVNSAVNKSVRQLFSPDKRQSNDLVYHSPPSNQQHAGVTNPTNSPSRNSTSSDKFSSSLPKPTFTTFGYDDTTDGHQAPTNSPEQRIQSPQGHEPTTSSTPRSHTSHSSQDEPQTRHSIAETAQSHQRQHSNMSTGFTPEVKDDNYMDMSCFSRNGNLGQRSRSSEGLLDDTYGQVKRSHSENRNYPSYTGTQNGNYHGSQSESRTNLQNGYYDNTSRPLPQPSVISSRSVTHPQYSSTPYTSHKAVHHVQTRPTERPPVAPKPVYNSYTRTRDVSYNNNNNQYGDNTNDYTYSTVRNVKSNKDVNHNLPVNSRNCDIYHEHSSNSVMSYNHLEPRSKSAYSTYLTGDPQYSRENSPNICNNSKEDSSSNPDSGYSSKIYGDRRATPVSASSTPSSSFSTDRGISLPSNTNSPMSQYSNKDYEGLPQTEYQDEIQNHIQTWYQRKLQETTQKVYDNWRNEKSPLKSKPNGTRYGNSNYGNPVFSNNNYSNSSYGNSSYSNSNYGNSNYDNSNYAEIPYKDTRQGISSIPQNLYNRQTTYNGNIPTQTAYNGNIPTQNGHSTPSYTGLVHSSDV